MPLTKQEILAEAKTLNVQEREELIDELCQISDGYELTPEQLEELRRRDEALKRGEMKTYPVDWLSPPNQACC